MEGIVSCHVLEIWGAAVNFKTEGKIPESCFLNVVLENFKVLQWASKVKNDTWVHWLREIFVYLLARMKASGRVISTNFCCSGTCSLTSFYSDRVYFKLFSFLWNMCKDKIFNYSQFLIFIFLLQPWILHCSVILWRLQCSKSRIVTLFENDQQGNIYL